MNKAKTMMNDVWKRKDNCIVSGFCMLQSKIELNFTIRPCLHVYV